MSRSKKNNLESAAKHLMRMDKFRAAVAGLLRYDVMVGPAQEIKEARARAQAPNPWAGGDLRAPISVIPAIAVMRANRNFCRAAEDQAGCGILPAATSVSPNHRLSGHPSDPLVEFQNGLILRSVAAAEYVLEQNAR